MIPVRYIYISDQGRVFRSTDDPTPEDFAYAAVGMVTILRLADCCYYGTQRKWQPIPEGELGTAEIEDEEAALFHDLVLDSTLPVGATNGSPTKPKRVKPNSSRVPHDSTVTDAQR